MSRLEKTTDLIVFNQLRLKNYVDGAFNELDKKVKVWDKKSSNRKINDILSKSSKKGTGQKGFPEYLIYDEKEKIVIVIENKKDLNKHFYENADEKVSEYAVNGALWYASFLKEEFNVIAIGISGNKTEELKIDSFAWRKGVETFTNLNLHELSEIKVYRDIINKSIKASKSRNSLIELNEKAIEINEFLRNILGVIEHERLYVVGSILFALEDPVFKISYGQINS